MPMMTIVSYVISYHSHDYNYGWMIMISKYYVIMVIEY